MRSGQPSRRRPLLAPPHCLSSGPGGGGAGSLAGGDGPSASGTGGTAPDTAAVQSSRLVYLGYLFLDNGEVLRMPTKREEVWPSYDLSWEEAVQVQMEALRHNNVPTPDHGIEVLYRFADFSPFERCNYFGRSLDLGQFERFRRVMHSPPYDCLLGHELAEVVGVLQVNETKWWQRMRVTGLHDVARRTFDLTMVQRVGGRYDGYWFCESLVYDPQSGSGGE